MLPATATDGMLASFARLAALLDEPEASPVLAPLIQRGVQGGYERPSQFSREYGRSMIGRQISKEYAADQSRKQAQGFRQVGVFKQHRPGIERTQRAKKAAIGQKDRGAGVTLDGELLDHRAGGVAAVLADLRDEQGLRVDAELAAQGGFQGEHVVDMDAQVDGVMD